MKIEIRFYGIGKNSLYWILSIEERVGGLKLLKFTVSPAWGTGHAFAIEVELDFIPPSGSSKCGLACCLVSKIEAGFFAAFSQRILSQHSCSSKP